MTEDEAKTKWCPFVRAILATKGDNGLMDPAPISTFNRIGHENTDRIEPCSVTHCIASACMAWRWDRGYRTYLDSENNDVSESTINGHCGLAGPQ